MKSREIINSKIAESPKPYEIESELGTLSAVTHQIVTQASKVAYDIANEYFESIQPKERYRSSRYNELLLDYATDTSYRKLEKRLNRLRQQTEGAKATTIRNIVEREGRALNHHMLMQARDALSRNGFTIDGVKKDKTPTKTSEMRSKDEADINTAAMELGLTGKINPNDYEHPEQTVEISIDDVGVKRQASTRPNAVDKGERKYVYQTVVQVSRQKSGYMLNGRNQHDALTMLKGFLLSNGLMWTNRLVFFIDGETALRHSIEKAFDFLPIKIILDWYHVDKKVKERLSMGMAGYKLRNALLEQLRPLLWKGDISAVVKLLESLPDKQVKSYDHIQKLIDYLNRNRPYIPCYAMRSRLGLCNSSNRGEKANDMAVAARQKHNGMSWSMEGSIGLSSICVASHNDELVNWISRHSLDFSLHNNAA